MNRQVIPSMLLSVLIVCSFAVVLFERDPDAVARRPDRNPVAERDTEASTPTSSNPTKDEASRPATPAVPGEQATHQSIGRPTEPIGQGPPSKEPKPIAPPAPGPAAPAAVQERPRSPDSREPGAVVSSTESSARPAAPPVSPPAQASTGPRSAFTVVQGGETLKEVAVRVYGSADHLDRLWRANRDVLPRSDSPLATGAVLRTPDD